jgi:di/tricarboxylate transporter
MKDHDSATIVITFLLSDFPKIGAPLNILLWIVASILIPIFWPFVPKP